MYEHYQGFPLSPLRVLDIFTEEHWVLVVDW